MEVVARAHSHTEQGDTETLDLVFEALPRSISAARHAVRRMLNPALRVPTEVAEDVLLLVSELVTNAVLHARTAVHVSACVEPGRIMVAIGDDDPHHAPRRTEPPALATSGRGMRLVDLLATSWGVDVGTSSKVVWFETRYQVDPIDLRPTPLPTGP